jgi:hypothetical protein
VPDPVFLALAGSLDADGLDAAMRSFLFPGEVVTSPYSEYLERRLAEVQDWPRESGSQCDSWILQVEEATTRWIQQEQRQEAEDDW